MLTLDGAVQSAATAFQSKMSTNILYSSWTIKKLISDLALYRDLGAGALIHPDDFCPIEFIALK